MDVGKLDDIARKAEGIRSKIISAVVQAEQESLKETVDTFHRQSSGGLTRRDLRRMGHPFARSAPQSPVDASKINIGEGTFSREWQQEGIVSNELGTEGSAYNASESARWLATGGKGRSKMVERPIVEAVKQEIQAPRKERLERAYKDAFRGM